MNIDKILMTDLQIELENLLDKYGIESFVLVADMARNNGEIEYLVRAKDNTLIAMICTKIDKLFEEVKAFSINLN